jgi:predicted RecA/RadA family phage recombinase
MTARYVQKGDSIDFIPTEAVNAGDVVILGDLVGIAKLDIAAGELGSLALVGVFDIPKAAGAVTAGAKIYYDAVNAVATTEADDGGDPAVAFAYLGKVVADAADTDETVRIRLCP